MKIQQRRRATGSFRNHEEGFTLIELMVVIFIISILAVLALALFRAQQVDTIRRSIQYDVRNTATQVQVYLVTNRNATAEELQANVEPIISPDNTIVIEGDWENWIVYGYNERTDPTGGWWFVYDSAAGTWTVETTQPTP